MIEYQAEPSLAKTQPKRDVKASMLRGWNMKCPACGKGALFRKYLKVNDACPTCGEELHHQRADDAPPYFTMVVVGHVVIAGVLALEKAISPPSWLHLIIWLPLTIILSLVLLPLVKGTLVGLQWALRMHGFSGKADTPESDPAAH